MTDHHLPEVVGYAQLPSKNEDRCPVSGLKRGTFLKKFKEWRKHPVCKVPVVELRESESASRCITLYNKGDLLRLLNYEAEQQAKFRNES